MERRVFIALFLSFLVFFTYQAIFPSKPTPKPGATPAAKTAAVNPEGSAQGATVPAEPTAAPGVATLVGEQAERTVTLETPHVIAVFTNRGGRLKSWKLKEYLDRSGRPLELIDQTIAGTGAHPLPFSLALPDPTVSSVLNQALYAVRTSGEGQVTFDLQTEAGLKASKSFALDPQSYTFSVTAQVSVNGADANPVIQWGPGLGDTDSQTGRYAVKPEALFATQGRKPERLNASKIGSTPNYEDSFDYAGIDDHYFAAFALKPGRSKLTYQAVQVPPPSNTKEAVRDLMAFAIQPASPGQTLTFYVGPKEFDTLASIDRNLVKAINFGMFDWIVVPLLRSLNWIHGYVGNYGWAIFILTLLINLVLFPLNHKSVVSMRKMQEIQPEAKAIQERYAKYKSTDPARQNMNQELMALYRENGVNPATGCIPILLTLPVFLAFYALLTTAIELRGAPFIGWIHDLSLPDPYYVMPVLVGASQVIQQWLTPQAGVDPAQQKMMMIMPVVLIFVFVSTPAGALIYWLVGNVWRIIQMQLTNFIHPPKLHVVRPAAERRVKRVGGSRTDDAREN
ncbi:MAG: membrane protein insertase YidC [Acidobacteria bacterium]|nr:membrane protein insertase YidC [Acidobacteriota bacterium]